MSDAFSLLLGMGTLLYSLFLGGCERSFEPLAAEQTTPPVNSEDEVILQGKVRTNRGGPAIGATVWVFKYDNYSDTLAVATVDSEGVFQISGLPEGKLDLIVRLEGFFSWKWSPFLVGEGINNRDTVLNNITDKEGHFDPETITVKFKPEISRSQKERIIAEEGLTIEFESVYDGLLGLTLPVEVTAPEMIDRLIMRQEVQFIEPTYLAFPAP